MWLRNFCCLWLLITLAPSWALDNCELIWPRSATQYSSIPSSFSIPSGLSSWSTSTNAPGDYSLNTGSISNNYVYNANQPTVRVYRNGSLSIGNNVKINASGNPENLIILVNGSVTIGNNSIINAFIFATGSITTYNNSVVRGGITAWGRVALYGSAYYDSTGAANIQGGSFCVGGSTSVTLRAHYPLDICSDLYNESVPDLTGSYNGTAYNVGGVTGQVYRAGDFSDASNDVMTMPASLLNGESRISVSLWFKMQVSGQFQELMSATNSTTNNEFELYIRNTDRMRMAWRGQYYPFTNEPLFSINNWYHIALTVNNGQACLYINGSLHECVSVSSGSLSVNRLALGAWWKNDNALGDNFEGAVDEVLVYRGALTASQISSIYNNQRLGLNYDGSSRAQSCPAVDHYRIELSDNQGLTCEAKSVTVKACANASCSQASDLYTDTTTVSLSPENSQWQGGASNRSLTNGQASFSYQQATPTTVTFGLTATDPTASVRCFIGGSEVTLGNCQASFTDTGFIFDTIDPQVSGQTFSNINIRAVRTDTNTGACTTALSGKQTVKLALDCLNPSTCHGNAAMQFYFTDGNGVEQTLSKESLSDYVLDFGSTGQAQMTSPVYTDAGQLQLQIEKTVDTGKVLSANSNSFVVRPERLLVEAGLWQSGFVSSTNSVGSDATSTAFVAAGSSFGLRATAQSAVFKGNRLTTLSIGQETTPPAVALTASLQSPAAGSPGAIQSVLAPSFSQGQASWPVRYSEVGAITINAAIADYLLSGASVTGALSNVGRFYPAQFALQGSPSFAASCGTTHYQSQPFSDFNVQLQAQNALGDVTQNYQGDYVKSTWRLVSGNNQTGNYLSHADLASRLSYNYTPTWALGLSDSTVSDVILARAAAPEAPLANWQLALEVNDTDGATLVGNNVPWSSGACTSNCSQSLGADVNLRYGRTALDNLFGSEQESLWLALRNEYFDGTQFRLNVLDSCYAVSTSRLQVPAVVDGVTLSGQWHTPLTLAAGSLALQTGYEFAAPAAPLQFDIQYQTENWLKFDYDDDGNDDYPQATVQFGLFRGNDRVIYWREVP